jgi:hypothetical protein
MSYAPTDKQKSIGFATAIYILLLFILFLIRFWPPSNLKELVGGGGGGGVEMNFGDSDYGLGKDFKSEVLNVKDQVKVQPTKATPEEDIISDDNSDDDRVAITKTENAKKTPIVVKKEVKPVVEKPKVTKNTNDALSSILNSNKGGDGDDKVAGNKGKSNGGLSSGGYANGGGTGGGSGGGNGTGNGTGSGTGSGSGSGGGNGSGIGNGSGYSLGNRKALNKPSPNYNCQEQGKVAVQVSVDRNGNTISATPGVQGTTNTAKCLLDQAKIAAMNTKWQPDSNAPEKQVGKIIYSFTLN